MLPIQRNPVLIALIYFIISTADARRGHLEPIGNSGIIKPIHERNGFVHPREFLKEYVLKNRPVLMRGAILDSPAIKLWSDEYLREKAKAHPDAIIQVEFGKKETRLNGTSLPFGEFLETYNESDVYMVDRMPSFLESDVIIPWPLQCDEYKRSFEDNVMWFSSGGTKSVIHHDGYENINCLLRGRKRFLFVNTTKYKDVLNQIIDFENGTYGSVDVERVDLDKYPVYEGLEFFAADLNPGDCVYSPFLWIHQVQSWDSNLAVNMWWFRDINKLVNPATCSDTYNKSQTFGTATFHRTTIIETDADSSSVAFALRHGVARLVFTASGKLSVNIKEFAKIMTNYAKKVNRENLNTLASFFKLLDVNKNKRFDIEDLKMEMDEDTEEELRGVGSAWMSAARIYTYPLPVDFSNDSYKTMKEFTVDELPGGKEKEASKEPSNPQDKEPVLTEELLKKFGENDEL